MSNSPDSARWPTLTYRNGVEIFSNTSPTLWIPDETSPQSILVGHIDSCVGGKTLAAIRFRTIANSWSTVVPFSNSLSMSSALKPA